MKTKISILLLSLLLMNLACVVQETIISPENDQRIYGSGYLMKEIRELPEFNSVSMTTSGTVYVTQGSNQLVTVTSDENVLEYITTFVQAGKLKIGLQRGISVTNLNLTVTISMPEIQELATSSSGDIVGKNKIKANHLRLFTSSSGDMQLDLEAGMLMTVISSSGDMYLRGQVNQHDATLSSSGDLYAFNLISETTNITLSSSGDAEVYVTDLLNANLSSSGNIYYRGQPSIHSSVSSSGRLINAN